MNREAEAHQISLMKKIQDRLVEERVKQEELEVQQYEQSVRGATLMEDTDKVLGFMEEFIKRHSNAQKPRDNTMFRELNETDRESVNEILRSLNIHYKEVF